MCKCISYNQPKSYQTDQEVCLDPHDYGGDWATKIVCVDFCIVEQIKAVWQAGVKTGGCCCGHNKTPAPTLIIYHAKDAEKACNALVKADPDRPWQVIVWSH